MMHFIENMNLTSIYKWKIGNKNINSNSELLLLKWEKWAKINNIKNNRIYISIRIIYWELKSEIQNRNWLWFEYLELEFENKAEKFIKEKIKSVFGLKTP